MLDGGHKTIQLRLLYRFEKDNRGGGERELVHFDVGSSETEEEREREN
jgi:hypothetical protein